MNFIKTESQSLFLSFHLFAGTTIMKIINSNNNKKRIDII